MCTLLFVCPSRMESLFPPFLSKSCSQIPLVFKVWFSRNSSSHCQTRRLGSLTWGWEPSLQWVDFCVISVLQFVSHPPSSYGIDFIVIAPPPTVSLRLLLCLWMWGIFFGEFQCLPVDDCSAVSCDSGVLSRGSESTSFYSAISNQSPCSAHFLIGCWLLWCWVVWAVYICWILLSISHIICKHFLPFRGFSWGLLALSTSLPFRLNVEYLTLSKDKPETVLLSKC